MERQVDPDSWMESRAEKEAVTQRLWMVVMERRHTVVEMVEVM